MTDRRASTFIEEAKRFAGVLSGDGKRRLFIIGNYVRQRLLRPYHDWAMTVLSRLRCDGTYDQLAPPYTPKGCYGSV